MANEFRKTFAFVFLLLNFSLLAIAQGTGTQFITGPCKSDADCASGCCGFNTGKCAGAVVAQERDGGCGFGNAQPNDNATQIILGQAPKATVGTATVSATPTTLATVVKTKAPQSTLTIDPNAPGAANIGIKAGKQFITGQCTSDADCNSGCCGFNTGKCAGAIIAQTRDGGCGFGDAQPNDIAAQKLRGQA